MRETGESGGGRGKLAGICRYHPVHYTSQNKRKEGKEGGRESKGWEEYQWRGSSAGFAGSPGPLKPSGSPSSLNSSGPPEFSSSPGSPKPSDSPGSISSYSSASYPAPLALPK